MAARRRRATRSTRRMSSGRLAAQIDQAKTTADEPSAARAKRTRSPARVRIHGFSSRGNAPSSSSTRSIQRPAIASTSRSGIRATAWIQATSTPSTVRSPTSGEPSSSRRASRKSPGPPPRSPTEPPRRRGRARSGRARRQAEGGRRNGANRRDPANPRRRSRAGSPRRLRPRSRSISSLAPSATSNHSLTEVGGGVPRRHPPEVSISVGIRYPASPGSRPRGAGPAARWGSRRRGSRPPRAPSTFEAAVPRPPEMIAPGVAHALALRRRPAGDERDLRDVARGARRPRPPPAPPPRRRSRRSARARRSRGPSAKSWRTSRKVVPMIGSPPMPTQVDWPRPASVIAWTAS